MQSDVGGTDPVFAPGFKTTPFWWDTSAPADMPDTDLPSEVDVLIVGSGYTGLNAALQTARDGLSTLIIDADAAGWGCSTRNGGQVSTSVKPGFAKLRRRYGDEAATALLEEGQASLDYIAQLVADEALNCDFRKVGRFHGAHKRHLYDRLAAECRDPHPVWKTDAFMVPKSGMASELGTEFYHGGIVYPHHCSIDVGKFHPALLSRVLAAGAIVKTHCQALSVERGGTGFTVETVAGRVRAGKVILATNGYTGALVPHYQRRIIPIGSYVIATEEMSGDLVDRLFPTDRVLSDTRKLVYYYRLSPDRKRLLFGGRVSLRETDARKSGIRLHRAMTALFPELGGVRLTHSWSGFVGYTFDTLAHCGEDQGLFFAMGYCGSGVGMASYLGMRMGLKASGREKSLSALERISFPTRPFYRGNPWFLAPSVALYRIRDRWGI